MSSCGNYATSSGKNRLGIGDFTLSSGKKSSYYLDCRMTTLDPRGALLIARLILARMREHKIQADAIGGLTMGADPIATAVAVVSALEGAPLPAFIVRKETKGHGTAAIDRRLRWQTRLACGCRRRRLHNGRLHFDGRRTGRGCRVPGRGRVLRRRSGRRRHGAHCEEVSLLLAAHCEGPAIGIRHTKGKEAQEISQIHLIRFSASCVAYILVQS